MVTDPARNPWGPQCASGRYLLHCDPPWTTERQTAPLWSSPWARKESAPTSKHVPSLLLHWLWYLQNCFAHFFSAVSPSYCTAFSALSYIYYLRGATSINGGLNFGQPKFSMEMVEAGSVLHENSFWCLLTNVSWEKTYLCGLTINMATCHVNKLLSSNSRYIWRWRGAIHWFSILCLSDSICNVKQI